VLLDHDAPSETFIRRELDALRRRGRELHVRYLTHGADTLPYAFRLCPRGYRLRFACVALGRVIRMSACSPLNALRMLKRLPQAAALVRDLSDTRSRLVWAQFAGITADIAGIAAATLKRPWLCSVHAHDVFTAPRKVLACRLRDAQRIIACSQAAADAALACGIARERVEVIHHGVPEVTRGTRAVPRENDIFSAGRLEPKKGFDTLLRACALLHARNIPCACRIAGSGKLNTKLRQLAEDLRIGSRVSFLGWLPEEQTLGEIRNARVVALASRRLPNGDRDGIANVVLEALAAGTPVVTTSAGAAGEVICDNVNGRLVPPDNPEALAGALTDVLANQETHQRLATAGRQTIATTFNPTANIRKLEACLDR